MVYFPHREPNGSWACRKIFMKRIPHTADFRIDGAEFGAVPGDHSIRKAGERQGRRRRRSTGTRNQFLDVPLTINARL